MIDRVATWTCDLCKRQEKGDDLPDGWRYAMGVVTYHICPNCRGTLERMLLISHDSWSKVVTSPAGS